MEALNAHLAHITEHNEKGKKDQKTQEFRSRVGFSFFETSFPFKMQIWLLIKV